MTDSKNIEKLTAEAVELLREMVAIPSPSFHEDAVCSHISNWLTAKGVEHERVGNNIIAEHITDPSEPTLMLCAHIDTVEPCEGYTFDPYKPENCPSDMVQGLGSNDDGASVVSMIAAYRYIHNSAKSHADTPNLTLVLTCEEERSGKGGMTGLWGKRLSQIDYAIVGEPTGMKAATSERGLLVIDATAHGISGHAARNEGINAIYIAIEDIDKIRNFTFDKVSPLMGDVNMSVTQINAGYAHNVIPDSCSFVVDIRPTDCYTNPEIMDILSKELKSELKPRSLTNKSSATPIGHPLLNALKKSNIESFISPTTSDWMRLSIPAVKIGPGDSARSHRADEYIKISEIEMGIDGYIKLIENL